MRVSVVRATAGAVDEQWLELPEGSTLADALRAAGLAADTDCGVFGHRRAADTVLHPGDRVELYRPLTVDPKEARRRRAAKRGRA